jgi:hypothetical protein
MIEEEPANEIEAPEGKPTRCPRCGYDLRGEMATWERACPIEGVCTECGLDIAWRELLNPTHIKPRWCVEYAKSAWGIPGRAIRTLMATCWPWFFWRSLRMVHDIRWRRLAAYVLLWMLALYLLFCVCHAALAFAYWSNWMWRMPSRSPDAFDLLMTTVLPLSESLPWDSGGGPSPRELFARYWLSDLYLLSSLAAMHGLCAGGFAALPVSRRRAKVRWRHIIRVLLYGFGWFVPLIALGALGTAPVELYDVPPLRDVGRAMRTLALLAAWSQPPFLVIWWSSATGRYLKMRHPWGVGLAVVVMAGLLTLFVALTISLATAPP